MPEEIEPTPPPANEPESFAPITSQEDLDKLLGKRLERERAKFADYEDAKKKAAEYDKLAEAQKTELQKANERAEAAERRATENERVALRTRVAAETGIPVEVLHGDDEDTIRAAATRVLEWRQSNTPPKPPAPKLKSGSSEPDHSGEKGRAAAALRTLRQG